MGGTASKAGADALARRNRETLVRVGLMVAIAFVLASAAPQHLVIAVFSGLLFISAFIAALFALVMCDHPFAGHFTRWDEAAALLGLSMAAGLMVHPIALDQEIEQQSMAPAAVAAGADG